MIAKKKIYHVLGLVCWGLLLAGVVTLLVSAVKTENSILCKQVEIELIDNNSYKMLDEGLGIKNRFVQGFMQAKLCDWDRKLTFLFF